MYIIKILSHLSSRYPGKSVILESHHISTYDCTLLVNVVDLSAVIIRDRLLLQQQLCQWQLHNNLSPDMTILTGDRRGRYVPANANADSANLFSLPS